VQQRAHELLVGARRRQPRDAAQVLAELRDLVAAHLVDPTVLEIARGARQRQVRAEQRGVDFLAAAARGVEHVKQHVHLERVDRGRQLGDEAPQLAEVRGTCVEIDVEIDRGR
jgi:hypothetical protein